jgi:hypothetical protein
MGFPVTGEDISSTGRFRAAAISLIQFAPGFQLAPGRIIRSRQP